MKHARNTGIITPSPSPDPNRDEGWCFPDTEGGILDAIEKGATHLWANTILFAQHPLQTAKSLEKFEEVVRVIGQPPSFVELFDDKDYVNRILRAEGTFSLPVSVILNESDSVEKILESNAISLPIVAKPVRGRGSHGVKLCTTKDELEAHCSRLIKESPSIILEQYLSGEEATITVMPPSREKPEYWSLPIITRFNHIDGIALYNGTVAVTQNSRVVSHEEFNADPAYAEASEQCANAAKLLHCKSPIRIDVRRYDQRPGSRFALFDFNMKPVSLLKSHRG